ncbi:hypothetical protein SCHPADRAFT_999400 [Schizopora paradoxa]|uniref:Fungal-type protein kinase domain-containing protein n=1 Tax=Schizopora paradoxa TaxID=27342 RepID=A0A0H2S103_9AGAM|nr:hypothetical protein SCHPADRAFT_999400 [Schizopora paradoxa]
MSENDDHPNLTLTTLRDIFPRVNPKHLIGERALLVLGNLQGEGITANIVRSKSRDLQFEPLSYYHGQDDSLITQCLIADQLDSTSLIEDLIVSKSSAMRDISQIASIANSQAKTDRLIEYHLQHIHESHPALITRSIQLISLWNHHSGHRGIKALKTFKLPFVSPEVLSKLTSKRNLVRVLGLLLPHHEEQCAVIYANPNVPTQCPVFYFAEVLVDGEAREVAIKETWSGFCESREDVPFSRRFCRKIGSFIHGAAAINSKSASCTLDAGHCAISTPSTGVETRCHVRHALQSLAPSLRDFSSTKEILVAIVDMIDVVRAAYDNDLQLGNFGLGDILLFNDQGGRRGILVDHTAALSFERLRYEGYKGSGPFMATDLLENDLDYPHYPHTFLHDIESLFYIMWWLMTLYDGPGRPRYISRDSEFYSNTIGALCQEYTSLPYAAKTKRGMFEDTNVQSLAPYFREMPMVNRLDDLRVFLFHPRKWHEDSDLKRLDRYWMGWKDLPEIEAEYKKIPIYMRPPSLVYESVLGILLELVASEELTEGGTALSNEVVEESDVMVDVHEVSTKFCAQCAVKPLFDESMWSSLVNQTWKENFEKVSWRYNAIQKYHWYLEHHFNFHLNANPVCEEPPLKRMKLKYAV